ncbi:MAG: TonB-dependent receptor [Prolixibacteraceae bacterium]
MKIAIKREQNPNLFEILSSVNNLREAKKNNHSWISVISMIWKLKLLKTMRLTLLAIVVSVVQIFAANTYSQETRLSLNLKNTSIRNVLEQIENRTDFYFIYNAKAVDVDKKVDVEFENKSVAEILDKLFEGTNVVYKIDRRQVAISANSVTTGIQQNRSVSGRVTDSAGSPLPGVTVAIKNTTQGTITDAQGNYSLPNVPSDAILIFSFVGMRTQEIPAGKTTIHIKMTEESIGLEEVVAIGYGTQKKATITGSIATVQGGDLKKVPSPNLSSMLAGRMTGVVVNTRGSAPGTEAVDIYIRGKSTWQGGGPLIIIDGIANRSGFEKLNPNDIESISVLKDASAAIYGSRAANGVILVTTKRGKDGKPTIEYTGDFGLTQPTRVPEMVRSWQYATYYTEAKRSGYTWTDEEIAKFKAGTDVNLYPNYNLEDYLLKFAAPQTTHTVSLRGGNNQVKYYVSGRYLYEDSFFKDGIDDFDGYTVRSNIDAQVNKNFTISIDVTGRRDDVRRAVGSGNINNIDVGFFEELLTDPTKPIFYVNRLPASIYESNVVERVKGKAGQKDTQTSTLNSQASFNWQLPWITKGLYLEGTAAYDYANSRTKEFSKSYDLYAYDSSSGEYVNKNTNPTMNRGLYDYFYNSYKYTLNGRIGYTNSFGDHHVNAFAAYEQYSINTEWIQATRSTFLSDQIPYQFAGDANTQKNDGSGSEFAYRNFFGRFGYSFKDKYLLDLTMRRDESLKFPKDNRVGWFPGISAGWRISEEDFMKERFGYVDNLKIRASYGQMGSDNVGDYQYMATAALYGTFDSYVFGASPAVVSTLHFTGTPNPGITWEVAKSYNVALEASLWKGLLGFELEYFLSRRSNILATRNASVPSYAGMTLPSENIGKAQNQGIEILLTHNRKLGDFSYGVRGNISFTSNKIIYMDESPLVPAYQRKEEHPIDSWLLFKTDGIFNTQKEFDATPVKRAGAQLGDIKYLDVNNDKVIDNNDRVRFYDSSLPKITYGLNLDFHYKAFDLSMLWQGQADAKTYINPTVRNGDINIPLWMYTDRWTSANAENATMPRAYYHRSDSYNTFASDFWLENASFLRLKTVEFAYNLPKSWISKASLTGARIYLSGFNLLLFDKIKNYDPEITNELGVSYPATKVYNVGVNITF